MKEHSGFSCNNLFLSFFSLDTRSRQSLRLTTSADFTDDEFQPETLYVS